MAKYCNCDNFYNIEDFKKGARVKFKELPITSMKKLRLIIDDEFSVTNVLFRVTSLGNISIVVELDKIPGAYFSPSVLTAIDVNSRPISTEGNNTLKKLISDFNDLSSENSYLRNLLNHSINGNF
jgi:hypothetical protein